MDIQEFKELKEEVPYINKKDDNYFEKYIVGCLGDFFKLLSLHKSSINIKEKSLYYRGQKKVTWEINPTLLREEVDILHNEDEIMHSLETRRSDDFRGCENALDKLTIMQHYGAPTRLLDITTNPLVALYFACEDGDSNSHAVVHIFEEEVRENKDYINIISSLAFFEDNKTIDQFKSFLENNNYKYKEEIINFALNKKKVLIKPKRNNERLIAQQGYFFLFSNNTLEGNRIKKKKFSVESNKIIIVDGEFKTSILQELETIGIKKSVIYPELANHAHELVERYKKENETPKGTSKLDEENNNDEDVTIIMSKKRNMLIKTFINNYDIEVREKLKTLLIEKDWESFSSRKAGINKQLKRYCKEVGKTIPVDFKEELEKLSLNLKYKVEE